MMIVKDGGIECASCGHRINDIRLIEEVAFVVRCPRCVSSPQPGIIQRALNFAKAVFHQAPLAAEALLTGNELAAFRSKEKIEAIAAVCKACPLFNGQVCTHRDCGCAIDEERAAWWSKIAWRSQCCPDDPPRWA